MSKNVFVILIAVEKVKQNCLDCARLDNIDSKCAL